jgi:hypothetical protein
MAAPHALRILVTLPVFMVLITLGVREVVTYAPTKWTWLVGLIIMGAYGGQFVMYWRFYSQVYPKMYDYEWQYGYPEMVKSIQTELETDPGQPVYITREQGRPAMYYWFYTQTDPRLVQAANATAKKDQSEFLEFQNMKFINTTGEITSQGLVASSEEGFQAVAATKSVVKLAEIKDHRQKIIWVIFRVEPD